ncbi:unnamed protein product, partial [Polarella glacialis]
LAGVCCSSDGSWLKLAETPLGCAWRREPVANTPGLLRVDVAVATDIALTDMPRPEVMFDMGLSPVGMVRESLVNINSPGDTLMRSRPAPQPNSTNCYPIWQLLVASTIPSDQELSSPPELASYTDSHLANVVIRRYRGTNPSNVDLFICHCVLDEITLEPTMSFSVHAKSIAEGRAIFHITMLDPGKVSSSLALPQFDQVIEAAHHRLQGTLTHRAMPAVSLADKSFYVVLQMRRCTSGKPLAPRYDKGADTVSVNSAEARFEFWGPTVDGDDKTTLAAYLRHFLDFLNFSDVEVFSSFEGRKLVSYQAIVRSSDWERAGSFFKQALGCYSCQYYNNNNDNNNSTNKQTTQQQNKAGLPDSCGGLPEILWHQVRPKDSCLQ